MTTVHVSIGNSDNKLTHHGWAEFFQLVHELLTETVATQTYGVWHSLPAMPYQNACWAIEVPPEHVENLKEVLGLLLRKFEQESAAWLEGTTQFIPGIPASASCYASTEVTDSSSATDAIEAIRGLCDIWDVYAEREKFSELAQVVKQIRVVLPDRPTEEVPT